MTLDDLKKIFLGRTLFRLETILSPRLVPVLYFVGLMALLLWAVIHLFATFSRDFGDGLWGLLEIVVFGTLGLLVLRVACEVLLVFFKTHENVARTVGLSLISSPLTDDVREAIHDIAEEEDAGDEDVFIDDIDDDDTPVTSGPRRRTAKRAPPAKPDL